MKKLAFVAVSTLLLSALAFAHGNLAHVMGTVVEVTDHSISVKIADGSVKVVAFDDETHFLKGHDASHDQRRCRRKPRRDSCPPKRRQVSCRGSEDRN